MAFDVFAPLDRRSRTLHRAAYRRFLLERNGAFEPRTGAFEARPARSRAPGRRGVLVLAEETHDARVALPALTLALFAERREMSAIGAFSLFPSTDVIRYRLKALLPEAVRRDAFFA
jgi:hypothetical protein